MNLKTPISEVMKTELITIDPETTLKRVEEIFANHSFHHLPVIDSGKLIGMLSVNDLKLYQSHTSHVDYNEGLEEFRLNKHRAKEIMTTGLGKLEPTDRLEVAVEVFKENLFHALPVVEDERLVGIITTYDIINTLTTMVCEKDCGCTAIS